MRPTVLLAACALVPQLWPLPAGTRGQAAGPWKWGWEGLPTLAVMASVKPCFLPDLNFMFKNIGCWTQLAIISLECVSPLSRGDPLLSADMCVIPRE